MEEEEQEESHILGVRMKYLVSNKSQNFVRWRFLLNERHVLMPFYDDHDALNTFVIFGQP